jgi:hypothetical protein
LQINRIVTLDKIRIACEYLIGKQSLILNNRVSCVVEDIGHQIALKIDSYVWKEPLGKDYVEVPASCWDHFKLEYIPSWAHYLFKRPVMRKVYFDVYAVYPNYNPAVPREQYRICVNCLEDKYGSRWSD